MRLYTYPLLASFLAQLMSCASILLEERINSTTFTTEERCAQGPFEQSFTTVEAPYGQAVQLRFLEGSAQAQLHYRIESEGALIQAGLIGTTQIAAGTDSQGNTQYKTFTPPSPCLAKEEKGSYVGTPTGVVVTPGLTSDTPPTGIMPPIKILPEPGSGGAYAEIKLPEWPAGKLIKITLWADVPYFIGEGWISLRLVRYYPKDPQKYAAWEAKQKQRDELHAMKRGSRSKVGYARRVHRRERRDNRDDRRREDVNPREAKRAQNTVLLASEDWESFKKKDQARIQEISAAMPSLQLHLQIERRAAFYTAYSLLDERYRKLTKLNDEASLQTFQQGVWQEAKAQSEQWSQWSLEYKEAIAATLPPIPTEPPGPPPLPWAEERGQAPVANATWRPGYWKWSGFAWVWYSGDWEFPAVPVQNNPVVVVAPPPKAEVITAPPQAGYVWITGAWRWNGSTYIWVRGVWVQLPSSGTPKPEGYPTKSR
jgi:hypothetical protein